MLPLALASECVCVPPSTPDSLHEGHACTCMHVYVCDVVDYFVKVCTLGVCLHMAGDVGFVDTSALVNKCGCDHNRACMSVSVCLGGEW
jgi:hypothetical protein